jgi:hypothetical protein
MEDHLPDTTGRNNKQNLERWTFSNKSEGEVGELLQNKRYLRAQTDICNEEFYKL